MLHLTANSTPPITSLIGGPGIRWEGEGRLRATSSACSLGQGTFLAEQLENASSSSSSVPAPPPAGFSIVSLPLTAHLTVKSPSRTLVRVSVPLVVTGTSWPSFRNLPLPYQ